MRYGDESRTAPFTLANRKFFECTVVERKSCVPVIRTIVDLADRVRKEGILSIEEFVKTSDSPFLRLGLGLVVDAVEPSLVSEILICNMVGSGKTGVELLKLEMYRVGILAIQAGDNPRIIEERLKAYLGFEVKMPSQKSKAPTAAEVLAAFKKSVRNTNSLNKALDFSRWSDIELAHLILCVDYAGAAAVLEGLDSKRMADVICEVAKIDCSKAELARKLKQLIEKRKPADPAYGLSIHSSARIDTVQFLANALRQVSSSYTISAALSELEEVAPELYSELQRKRFSFENLVYLEARSMQALISHTDLDTWAVALKSSHLDALLKLVLVNLPSNRASELQEAIECMGPIRKSDGEDAQEKIRRAAQRLFDAGEIIFPRH